MPKVSSRNAPQIRNREFHIKVLGRILEHLGVQMYKQRPAAIAELVSNAWDAGATKVLITIPRPEQYSQQHDTIQIDDNGCGMDEEAVESEYLVVARNRRERDQGTGSDVGRPGRKRPIMGRKGIGKLAAFGIAKELAVVTWARGKQAVEFSMKAAELKTGDNDIKNCVLAGRVGVPVPDLGWSSGTRVTLRGLKHKSPLDPDELKLTLARRLSRDVKGRMRISVNGQDVQEPVYDPPLELRFPEDESELQDETLSDGNHLRYWYGFSPSVIKPKQLQGFTVLVRGKTGQAAPFYFSAETGTAQHAAKYVTGVIEADFVDDGCASDEESEADIVSTDRQEIEWDHARVAALKDWGEKLCRRLFEQWRDRRATRLNEWLLKDKDLQGRLEVLSGAERKQIEGFLKSLSQVEEPSDRAKDLAGALIRAFEFRHFHDVIGDLDQASGDPDRLRSLLSHLHDWRVLESRAILEIVQGRLAIIDTFQAMLVNDAPETAHRRGDSNMHDLLADHPWLLNPKYQLLVEEKSVTKQLQEWAAKDVDEEYRGRFDFLGLSDERQLVVIEIKRAGHPLEDDELYRLIKYRDRLRRSEEREVHAVLIWGGTVNLPEKSMSDWKAHGGLTLLPWREVFDLARKRYEHHRAVLQADIKHPDFGRKKEEVRRTREVLQSGSVWRGPERRKKGLGGQDVDYQK